MKFYDKGGFKAEMDRVEAARTLGVGASAPPARIQAAHRRLMKILHPDGNGSACVSPTPTPTLAVCRHEHCSKTAQCLYGVLAGVTLAH